MDDYNISELSESKSEWSIRLVNILSPLVVEGIQSIFNESYTLCVDNDEEEKYLMTFQNFLSRVPKWNPDIIDTETKRIYEKCNCSYLEDLITCVHVCHLKILTCMRVGKTQKKIDVEWPKLNEFIHKVYVNTSRKLYTTIFLFEKNIMPLQIQKNRREVENIVQKAICDTIRDSIPVEHLLRAYLDETTDLVNTSIVKEEVIKDASLNEIPPDVNVDNTNYDNTTVTNDDDNNKPSIIKTEETIKPTNDTDDIKIKIDTNDFTPAVAINATEETKKDENITLSFNDTDNAISTDNITQTIDAPKDIGTLEKISNERHEARKQEEMSGGADDDEKIKIFDDPAPLTTTDVHDIVAPLQVESLPPLDGVEIIS